MFPYERIVMFAVLTILVLSIYLPFKELLIAYKESFVKSKCTFKYYSTASHFLEDPYNRASSILPSCPLWNTVSETVSEYSSDDSFVSSYTVCVFLSATQQAMHCTCSVVWCSLRCWSLWIPEVSAINLVACSVFWQGVGSLLLCLWNSPSTPP